MRFWTVKEGLWTFFMYLRRDWWECENFSSHSRQGKNHVSEKDAKSIPMPRKFRKAKLKDVHGLLQKGAKEPCILLTPTVRLCFGSEQAQTHPGLPDQCKRAGRSVQTGAGSSQHQNKSQIHLSHKTAWNPELHIKQKKGKAMLFSGFQTSGMLFAVSIPAVCFLALEQSLMSKPCQKPTRRKTELREFCKKGLSITATAVGVWHYPSLPSFERMACKSD